MGLLFFTIYLQESWCSSSFLWWRRSNEVQRADKGKVRPTSRARITVYCDILEHNLWLYEVRLFWSSLTCTSLLGHINHISLQKENVLSKPELFVINYCTSITAVNVCKYMTSLWGPTCGAGRLSDHWGALSFFKIKHVSGVHIQTFRSFAGHLLQGESDPKNSHKTKIRS